MTAPATATSHRSILRFLTCGSVDDGKSTLIGRLLYDAQLVLDDQLASLESESRTHGTTGGEIDFALLVDGLQAEREQGITIDVAYRYFSTAHRKFIVADTPGHVQYTRNMATGASNADLAVLLVDARKGILTQTRRHTIIAHLLGIRSFVLAINKMDLAAYDEARFREIVDDYMAFAQELSITDVTAIPLSALRGENIAAPAATMDWYHGPTLLSHLETVETATGGTLDAFRLPVQWVCRPNLDFRGYAGTVVAGKIKPGDPVVVLPSARTTSVARIVTADGDLSEAGAGAAVTLTLAEEIDISRGDVLAAADTRPELADQVAAHLVWMSEAPLLPGRPYTIRLATQRATATITALKHKIDVDSLEPVAGRELQLNEMALVNLSFSRPLVFDPYDTCRETGGFVLIDRMTHETVGAGMIRFALRRATNVQWQSLDIDRAARAGLKGQKPVCLWFTGLSGSGKSTVANLLERRLHGEGRHTYILDGDNVRHGLNRDLGFTDADRVENIRRVSEVARLMVDAGLVTMVSFISPFRAERRMARELFGEGEFLEVFVDTPLAVCEARDPKGLYRKARQGLIRNFTGIDSAYEPPEAADIVLDGDGAAPEQLAEELYRELERRGLLSG
ncbi:MAG: sulfate adenylyltransferase subunit CysN [Rhizobiales bacterium]|nr:sulfate adenylyltransferase subunit CysN [Hyphomicrobiales bacterium]